MRIIPGTTLKYSEQMRNEAFSAVSPVLEATGGLTLSQISKLTGIEGSTIQNWIKRGWVSATTGKKYRQRQVIRIILINMFRGVMKLEDIAAILDENVNTVKSRLYRSLKKLRGILEE